MTDTTQTATDTINEAAQAVASFRTQQDQWAIADALNVAVPPNTENQGWAFESIRRATVAAGVKPLSVSAMRQYRDTAARWAVADRLQAVNYTAHRTALGAKDPKGILLAAIKLKGDSAKVTVASVRQAVDASNGVVPVKTTKAAEVQTEQVAKTDWSSPVVLDTAVRRVGQMTKEQVATFLSNATVNSAAHYSDALRAVADMMDLHAGRNRPAPVKVGAAKKAPAKKKPATKKAATAAPKKGARRGRVKGA